MKMERLNAWMSLAGNIAVLLGLVALAVEINANTKAVRLQIMENSAVLTQEARLSLAGNADLQATITKSYLNPNELTPSELWGAVAYFERGIFDAQRKYRLYRDGVIPEAEWQSEVRSIPFSLATPFGKFLWSEERKVFADDPDFVVIVDSELAKFEGESNDEFLRRFHEKVARLNR